MSVPTTHLGFWVQCRFQFGWAGGGARASAFMTGALGLPGSLDSEALGDCCALGICDWFCRAASHQMAEVSFFLEQPQSQWGRDCLLRGTERNRVRSSGPWEPEAWGWVRKRLSHFLAFLGWGSQWPVVKSGCWSQPQFIFLL